MSFPKSLKELCAPAVLYFVVSMIALFLIVIQNIGNTNSCNIGSFSMRVPSTILIFLIELIYILFWTWVLNLICRSGHVGISWFLVLLPFILTFLVIGLVMINK